MREFNEVESKLMKKTSGKLMDARYGAAKELEPSRELSLFITKIEEAQMWLGKAIERNGLRSNEE